MSEPTVVDGVIDNGFTKREVHNSVSVLDLNEKYNNSCCGCGCGTSELELKGFVIFMDQPMCVPCYTSPSPIEKDENLPF